MIPISKPSVALDLLSHNAKLTFSGNKHPVPDDIEDYPGVSNLADFGIPKDEMATRIQKTVRGHMSRKNRIDLTDAELRAEALQNYYDPFKYSNPINRLRNFDIRAKDVHHELERKKLKSVINQREHFLGMDLPQLLLEAGRDPFKEKKLEIENHSMSEEQFAERLRISQVERGLKLDQLKWDVEESKLHPDLSDRRKSKGGKHRGNIQRNTPSNTDLGYSEEIEFDLQNSGGSSSTPGKSSLEIESFIEDLANSRSMSRSRSKGRLKPNRNLKASSSKDESIIENESSGFGFIKNEVKPQQQVNKNIPKFDVNEESDSNPFGVEKKPLTGQAHNPTKLDFKEQEKPSDLNSKNLPSTDKGAKQINFVDNYQGQPTKTSTDKVYRGLDPSIYGPLKEKNPYQPKPAPLHQSGGEQSKAIHSSLTGILKSAKANAQLIKDLEVLGESPPLIANLRREHAETSMKNNEKLSLQLLETLKKARNSIANVDQIAHLIVPLAQGNHNTGTFDNETVDNPEKLNHYTSENFFSDETFMKLYLKAVQSKQSFDAIDEERHQNKIIQLEDGIRRLSHAEGYLQEAVSRHKTLIEREKDGILRRFTIALQQKKEQRLGLQKGKLKPATEHQKTSNKEGKQPSIHQELGKPSKDRKQSLIKNLSPVITEESIESGTIISDYSESRERIESISWLDSASGKQQKFTTFN